MKQTAVDYLIEEFEITSEHTTIQKVIEKAKEMEKQQMWQYIKSNYVNGENSLLFHKEEFEKYYNKTYNL